MCLWARWGAFVLLSVSVSVFFLYAGAFIRLIALPVMFFFCVLLVALLFAVLLCFFLFCAGCCAFCLPRCGREKDGIIKGKGLVM